MVFPLGEVRKARIVHAQVGSLPLVLAAPEKDLPAVTYDRRVNDRALTFTLTETKPPALRDVETGTIWRLSDGLAVEGRLKGAQLTRVVAHPAFWFGWRGYFPYSENLDRVSMNDGGVTGGSPSRSDSCTSDADATQGRRDQSGQTKRRRPTARSRVNSAWSRGGSGSSL